MGNHPPSTWSIRELFLKALLAVLMGAICATTWAQSQNVQSPSAQSTPAQSSASDLRTGAGGKMAFDVASVKRNTSGPPPSFEFPNSSGNLPNSNVSLGPGDAYAPTGGLFTATNLTLLNYMVFAYKVTGNQVQLLRPQLPKWANTDRFDIEARAVGNPGKDQMRLMMQSLLADRFKLAVHTETKQLPVFALMLVKVGKTGPQLQPHSDESTCSTAPPRPPVPGSAPAPPATVADRFPTVCGDIVRMPASTNGRVRLGARNVTMALIDTTLTGFGNLDRPVLDQTGLSGTFLRVDAPAQWPLATRRGPPARRIRADVSGGYEGAAWPENTIDPRLSGRSRYRSHRATVRELRA